MSDAPTDVFRTICPNCQKVLKARLKWSGKIGICPNCKKEVQFPVFVPPSANSRTARQLIKLIGTDDNITLDDKESDKLSMLLSQGTCRDYLLATKLLAGRPLSPRQWRRVLNSSAIRESMRVHIEEQLERLAEIPDDDEEPAALVAAEKANDPNAWTIMIRFLYSARHGTCDACTADPTGLACIYLNFEKFLTTRQIPPDRSANWQKICNHHLGL